MRAILLAVVVALVAFAYATRGPEPGASARPFDRTPAATRAPATAALPEVEVPRRNVFEYGAPPAPDVAPATTAPAPTMPATPGPEPSPAVRLVGLLRRGTALQAALSIQDELMVLGKGESGAGYTVVEIDEEEGVTVRGPEGGTQRLPIPVD